MVDGFPLTRENWAAMIESDLLPDSVISIETSAADDLLLARFTEMKGLPDPASLNAAVKNKEEVASDGEVQVMIISYASL